MDRTELARRVRAARAYGGWTRADHLAKAVGIGRNRLLKLEHGDAVPKRWELIAIAELCGLPRSFFTEHWEPQPAASEDDDLGEVIGEIESSVRSTNERPDDAQQASGHGNGTRR